jgi:hypothetical protein
MVQTVWYMARHALAGVIMIPEALLLILVLALLSVGQAFTSLRFRVRPPRAHVDIDELARSLRRQRAREQAAGVAPPMGSVLRAYKVDPTTGTTEEIPMFGVQPGSEQ